MTIHSQRLALTATLAVTALVLTGCASPRSVHRGTWPDGRLEAPVVIRHAFVARRADPGPADDMTEDWSVASSSADSAMSAADLNRLGVLETVHFDYDSATLRNNQRAALDGNLGWLRANPTARILVEGHCDERGTREYNLALGTHRATSVREYLVASGIDPQRIETVSYGEELPADPGHTQAAWRENRRAEFVIVATGER